MKDYNNFENNIVQFRKKEVENNISNAQKADIIDMFACKKLKNESKTDKKLSNQYYINGRSLFQNKKFDKAFENFKKAEESGCDYVDLYLYLSRCFGIKHEVDKSIYYAKKAVALDKDCAEGYHLIIIGQILSDTVSDETFRFAVKTAMLGEYADDTIYYFAALFFLHDNHTNLKKAKKYIVSAIDYIMYEIENDKHKKIKEDYKIARLNSYYRIKAKTCFYLKEYDDALELYTTYEKFDKNNIEVYLHLCAIYINNNNLESALECINKAFELYNISQDEYDSELFEYMNYLKGMVLARLGDDSYMEFLLKGRKFFSDPKLLDTFVSTHSEAEQHMIKLKYEIKSLINEVIDDYIETKPRKGSKDYKSYESFFSSLMDNIGEDLYLILLNEMENENADNPKILEVIELMKKFAKNNI